MLSYDLTFWIRYRPKLGSSAPGIIIRRRIRYLWNVVTCCNCKRYIQRSSEKNTVFLISFLGATIIAGIPWHMKSASAMNFQNYLSTAFILTLLHKRVLKSRPPASNGILHMQKIFSNIRQSSCLEIFAISFEKGDLFLPINTNLHTFPLLTSISRIFVS